MIGLHTTVVGKAVRLDGLTRRKRESLGFRYPKALNSKRCTHLANWFHGVVVPAAPLFCFPNGKTKFHRPDGSIGKEPGTGIVLLGMGDVACAALRRSGIGVCMTIDRSSLTLHQGGLFPTDGRAPTDPRNRAIPRQGLVSKP